MTHPKRHLVKRLGAVTACGLQPGTRRYPQQVTTTASQVTCLVCQRTLSIADAEVRDRRRR